MLIGEHKVGCGEEAVEHREHFPHHGDDADLRWFSGGPESSIKLSQDAVTTHSGDSRHIEHMTNRSSAATHMSGAKPWATVIVKRCDAHQGRDGRITDRAQFRHIRQQGAGEDRPNTGQLLQPGMLLPQSGVVIDMVGDRLGQRFQFLLQEALFAFDPRGADRAGLLQLITHFHQAVDQIAALIHQIPQLRHGGVGWSGQPQLYRLSVAAQHLGVEGIIFGLEAFGVSVSRARPGCTKHTSMPLASSAATTRRS